MKQKRIEHLCSNCARELKEYWPYIANEVEVVIVRREFCDNFSDKKGILNAEKDGHKTITIKRKTR
ncbi:MAG: hypothetical protein EOM19_01515 [Candidatus Moranbacteria bacterium]|nr:hypothetical protein [Candidatus Moranbacteria bacterium]